jgi:hypothetical protein
LFDCSRKDWNFERAVFEKFIYRRKSEKRRKKLQSELEFRSTVLAQKSYQAAELAEIF